MSVTGRVLFIALAFPPHPGSGTLRSAKFVKYLGAFGWQPIVITLDWERVLEPRVLDASLLEDIPPHVPVYRLDPFHPVLHLKEMMRPPSPPPADRTIVTDSEVPLEEQAHSWLYRGLRSLYHGLLAPVGDEHFYWAWRAVPDSIEIALRHRVDVIFVSVSPWTSGFLGLMLKMLLGLPLLVDFRDYWTLWPIKARRPVRDRLDALAERLLLRTADRIICVHEAMADDVARLHPRAASRCVVIPNGYDPEDFPDPGPMTLTGEPSLMTMTNAHHEEGGERERPFPSPPPTRGIAHEQTMTSLTSARSSLPSSWPPRTSLVHTGMVWGDAAGAVLRALAQLRPEGIEARLHVCFVGGLPPSNIRFLRDHQLESLVAVEPRTTHRTALQRMKGADVLLLLLTSHEGGRKWYPGKLFEYLVAGKPVLAIAPPGLATRLIEEAGVGTSVDHTDAPRLIEMIRWIAHHPDEFRERFYHPQPSVIARYDRRRLTERLAETLREVCSGIERSDVPR